MLLIPELMSTVYLKVLSNHISSMLFIFSSSISCNSIPRSGCSALHRLNSSKSKFEWMFDDITIEKIISAPIWATTFFFFFEVSALPYGHCPKLQSCAISRKYNNATLWKWQKPQFQTQLDPPLQMLSVGFIPTSS